MIRIFIIIFILWGARDSVCSFGKANILNLFRHHAEYNENFELLEEDKIKNTKHIFKNTKNCLYSGYLRDLFDNPICLLLCGKNKQICMHYVCKYVCKKEFCKIELYDVKKCSLISIKDSPKYQISVFSEHNAE